MLRICSSSVFDLCSFALSRTSSFNICSAFFLFSESLSPNSFSRLSRYVPMIFLTLMAWFWYNSSVMMLPFDFAILMRLLETIWIKGGYNLLCSYSFSSSLTILINSSSVIPTLFISNIFLRTSLAIRVSSPRRDDRCGCSTPILVKKSFISGS